MKLKLQLIKQNRGIAGAAAWHIVQAEIACEQVVVIQNKPNKVLWVNYDDQQHCFKTVTHDATLFLSDVCADCRDGLARHLNKQG